MEDEHTYAYIYIDPRNFSCAKTIPRAGIYYSFWFYIFVRPKGSHLKVFSQQLH